MVPVPQDEEWVIQPPDLPRLVVVHGGRDILDINLGEVIGDQDLVRMDDAQLVRRVETYLQEIGTGTGPGFLGKVFVYKPEGGHGDIIIGPPPNLGRAVSVDGAVFNVEDISPSDVLHDSGLRARVVNKAYSGDEDAQRLLAQTFGNNTVFLDKPQDTVDAMRWALRNGAPPPRWGMEPTKTARDKFKLFTKLDPVHLLPLAGPSPWAEMWNLKQGHTLIAAISFGCATHLITGAELDLLTRAQAYLRGEPWPALDQLVRELEASGRMDYYMDQVMREPGEATGNAEDGKYDVQIGHVTGQVAIGDDIQQTQVILDGTTHTSRMITYLTRGFNPEELKCLAMDVGCDHEDLPGHDSKSALARELWKWAVRYGKQDDLERGAKQVNPSAYRTYVMGV